MTDGLILPWTVLALAIVVESVLRSQPAWLRLGLSLLCIALLTTALVPLVNSPLQPHFAPDADVYRPLSERIFVSIWWVLIARIVIAAGRLYLRVNHQRHAARLASDLVAGAVYLGALLAVLDLAFGVSLTGLVATSGIIAIVLGLALQNTLGDLFSAVAIGIDKPFDVGDTIWIEGAIEGKVVETNWRSTRIVTSSNDIATVPNSVVAKSRILNRSSPSELRTATIKIVLDPIVPPHRTIGLLQRAVLTSTLVAPKPAPALTCTELRGDGSVYELTFSAPMALLGDARSDLLQQISRHMHYEGVALATQNGTPPAHAVRPTVLQLLDDIIVLHGLDDAQRAALVPHLLHHAGDPGRVVFRQDGSTASLFVVASGVFEVTRDDGHGPFRIGTLGPGEYFGEVSLLTGAPNAATVTALTPFVTYELTKATISPLVEHDPALLRDIEEGARKAQTRIERSVAAQACPNTVSNHHFLDRVRAFFEVKEHHAPQDSTHGA
jgi:small-conductance mechanosensitive channel